MQMKEEEQLISRAKNGEAQAFETLVKKYEKALNARIMSFVRAQELALEIYQNTLIKVYEEIEQCEYDKGGFYAFFVNTAHFMVKRHYEEVKRDKLLKDSLYKFNSLNQNNSKKKREEEAEVELVEESNYQERVNYKLKQLMEVYDLEKQSTLSAEEEALNSMPEKTIYDYCFEVLHELGQPHKLMIFLLNKVIYAGKLSNKSGSPKQLIEDCNGLTMLELFEKVKREFQTASSLPSNYIEQKFSSLFNRIVEQKLQEKTLKEFFGKDPEANISDWSYRTGKKLKSVLEEKYFKEMYEI